MKQMSGNPKDSWTPAVMLYGILTLGIAFEDTLVARTTPVLKSPMGAPTIPNGGEHRSMHSRSDQAGQCLHSPRNTNAVTPWRSRNAKVNTSPPLDLVADSLYGARLLDSLNRTKGCPLKILLNLAHCINPIEIRGRADFIKYRLHSDVVATTPSKVVNKDFAIIILIPIAPMPNAVNKISLAHVRVQGVPAIPDIVRFGSQHQILGDGSTTEMAT